MRRLNRLPIIIAIVIIALFVGVVVIGLSLARAPLQSNTDLHSASNTPQPTSETNSNAASPTALSAEPWNVKRFSQRPPSNRRSRRKHLLSSAGPRRGRTAAKLESEEE